MALPAEASKRAATEAKEETKKEARDAKMPAREPIRMRRAKTWDVEVENAYRFQCAGWRSAEEYAQGEYGDEISWFSDSGLVEKVQNRQGLFMYFKRLASVSATLPRWRRAARSPRRRGAGGCGAVDNSDHIAHVIRVPLCSLSLIACLIFLEHVSHTLIQNLRCRIRLRSR